jgi:hypothetical protein
MTSPFRLSLRDVLWLTLLVAEVVALVQTHRRDVDELLYWRRKEVPTLSMKGRMVGGRPRKDGIEPDQLRQLSDEVLIARLEALVKARDWSYTAYEYYLAEMARRKLTDALARHYAVMKEQWPRAVEALTALRRSRGEPDPLSIQLAVTEETDIPLLQVTAKNVDPDHPLVFVVGMSKPSRGQWRIVMTDSDGKAVAASNLLSPVRSSASPFWEKLPVGDSFVWKSVDLRHFVAPPRSGIYQVQLLYHDFPHLARERDWDGLIYFQSAPITIRVHNPDDPPRLSLEGAIPLAVALVPAGLLISSWAIARRTKNRMILWRDIAWCAVILIVGVVWFADQQHLWQQIREALPHADALWTIEAVKP